MGGASPMTQGAFQNKVYKPQRPRRRMPMIFVSLVGFVGFVVQRVLAVAGAGALLMCVSLLGQTPSPGREPPQAGFDISGYWTAVMHEDALERGGGPEIGDSRGVRRRRG